MIGAIFIGFILLMTGIFMVSWNLFGLYPSFEYTVINVTIVYMFAIPVLTMRSFAEEKHSRTDQLLYSLPMNMTSIVMAKFLAMVTILAVPVLVMCLYPLILGSFGAVNYVSAYGAILAYFLLGCLVIAIGTFISSLFESQVICAIVNLSLLLVLYFMTTVTSYISDSAVVSLVFLLILAAAVSGIVYFSVKNIIASAVTGGVLAAAALVVYFVNAELYTGLAQRMISTLFIFTPVSVFAFGTFDITCFIYYLSLTVLFVFFTIQSFEKRRWD